MFNGNGDVEGLRNCKITRNQDPEDDDTGGATDFWKLVRTSKKTAQC